MISSARDCHLNSSVGVYWNDWNDRSNVTETVYFEETIDLQATYSSSWARSFVTTVPNMYVGPVWLFFRYWIMNNVNNFLINIRIRPLFYFSSTQNGLWNLVCLSWRCHCSKFIAMSMLNTNNGRVIGYCERSRGTN